ncbi:MAG: ATP-binding protein [Chitinispirillia bacterium]
MFIGRKKEINAIKEVLGSVIPGIVVIYGRRRIGKSELIKQSVKGISVFNFEGAEGQSSNKQIKNFQDQLDFQIGVPYRNYKPSSWKEVLLELVKELQKSPRPVILVS